MLNSIIISLKKGFHMVDKALDLAETMAKFTPKVCKISDALVIIICFTAFGLLAGFFIGMNLSP